MFTNWWVQLGLSTLPCFKITKDGFEKKELRKWVALNFTTKNTSACVALLGNCDVCFQIQQSLQTKFDEQDFQINIDRMVDLIDEEIMSIFDIMFWRGIANPQSGELNDCTDQIHDLWHQVILF